MTDSANILKELNARVAGLTFELAGMRSVLAIQFKRIAALQAEIDLLPTSRRRRREVMRPPMPTPSPGHHGNGRSHG